MKASVIIVNYNTTEYTIHSVDSIYTQRRLSDIEVFVVDNGSRDNSIDVVTRLFPRVRLLKSKTNLGFARGNNLAIPYTTGNYIALLNSDAYLLNDALGEMCEYLEKHSRCGIVGPQLLSPSGQNQQSVFKAPTASGLFLDLILGKYYRAIRRDPFEVKRFDYGTDRRIDGAVSGACLVVRREIMKNDHILDPNFFFNLEDVDLCYSTMKEGWEIHYCASAKVAHIGSATLRKENMRDHILRRELYWNSVGYYFRKHSSHLQVVLFKAAAAALFFFLWGGRCFLSRIKGDEESILKSEFSRRMFLNLFRAEENVV